MKRKIDGIIVVEGSNDASVISSLANAEIVSINGCELKNINYLKKASELCSIFLMTDPDKEGTNLRDKIKKEIPSAIDIIIDIDCCTKGSKNGVAECENNELLRAISKYFVDFSKNENNENFPYISKEHRVKVCQYLGIENCNFKTFKTRMKRLKINKEKIDEIIGEK